MAGRPKREQAPAIRREILSAAMGEFGARGFHGGSIASIAARAEVSRRTIYNQFQTKEQIFEVLVENTSTRIRDRVVAELETPGEPYAILFNVGMCFQEEGLLVEGRAISRLLVMEAPNLPAMARKGLAARQSILSPIATYLARLAREGVLVVADADRAAQQFLHLTTGSIDYLFGEDHSAEEQQQWVAAAVRTFLYGMCAE